MKMPNLQKVKRKMVNGVKNTILAGLMAFVVLAPIVIWLLLVAAVIKLALYVLFEL